MVPSFYTLSNHVLKTCQSLNREALSPLRPHEGKVLRFQATDSPLGLSFKIQDQQLVLVEDTVEAHTTLSGKTVDLGFAFLKRETGPHALMTFNLVVVGDTSLLQAFHLALQHLPPDPEAILAGFTGDIVATSISKGLRSSWHSLKDFVNDRAQDLAHFGMYEKPWLVTPEAFELFKLEIQQLRRTVEELKQKTATKKEVLADEI